VPDLDPFPGHEDARDLDPFPGHEDARDLDPFPGDEDADLSPWVSPDPMTTGSHAPWESGDRP
jgi:hypothetical protein